MSSENCVAAAAAQIKKAHSAAIFCHSRPDGDAIGSGLALCLAMRAAGKRAYFVCEDVPPEKFFFIPAMKEVLTSLPEEEYDLFITVDCAEVTRTGSLSQTYLRFRGRR